MGTRRRRKMASILLVKTLGFNHSFNLRDWGESFNLFEQLQFKVQEFDLLFRLRDSLTSITRLGRIQLAQPSLAPSKVAGALSVICSVPMSVLDRVLQEVGPLRAFARRILSSITSNSKPRPKIPRTDAIQRMRTFFVSTRFLQISKLVVSGCVNNHSSVCKIEKPTSLSATLLLHVLHLQSVEGVRSMDNPRRS